MQTIKETKEVFDFADKMLDELVEHKTDDGKIDAGEWLRTAMATAPAGIKAVMGVDKVDDELKDLSPEETKELAGRGVMLAQKLMQLMGFE